MDPKFRDKFRSYSQFEVIRMTQFWTEQANDTALIVQYYLMRSYMVCMSIPSISPLDLKGLILTAILFAAVNCMWNLECNFLLTSTNTTFCGYAVSKLPSKLVGQLKLVRKAASNKRILLPTVVSAIAYLRILFSPSFFSSFSGLIVYLILSLSLSIGFHDN